MKFIHIADVHLGAEPDAGGSYSAGRAAEIWNSFRQLIEVCRREETELLLIAGDLFHRQPLLRELKEVDYLFSTIPETQVVLIAGNHDYLKKNSYYRTFCWSGNVHMILNEELTCVELPEIRTAVYGLSYAAREIREPLYDAMPQKTKMPYRILLAHGGDEAHIPFRRDVLGAKGYDYVALGHIHKPGELIPGRMAYAGALEPIDKNDTGFHGYMKGILDKNGCRAVFVPFAKREYVHLELNITRDMTGFALRTLLHQEMEKTGVGHIYKIILKGYRDPEVSFDFQTMDIYGNIVEVADETRPAYDFDRLRRKNEDNLIGRYIESFAESMDDEVEYEALCEGVCALLETRRGQA